MGQSNYHERPDDIARPDERTAEQDEHDPFSFESMCRIVEQTNRTLRLRNRMLERSAMLAAVREEAENGG